MPGGDRPVLAPLAASATALPAEVRETHSAVVLLMGDLAFKVKKPVDLGFLDFTTPALREAACRRELAVNRRIAPDVYLGVAAVRMTTEPAQSGEDGPDHRAPEPAACEHVLVMRRMPDDRRLARLVSVRQTGEDTTELRDHLRRLARLVAAFHATARTSSEIAGSGSPAALSARWRGNLDRFRRQPGAVHLGDRLAVVERLASAFVDGRHPLLEARMRAGLVRDGHGDLLADDIFCLPDGPRVLDALDFDERLRWVDVLDDVACLAMDLERLGAPELGAAFLRDYAEFSGSANAAQPDRLAHHYIAYRAVMRAMVTAIQRTQHDVGRSVESGGSGPPDPVRRLLEIGERHLHDGQVRLVVVAGGPATGKTTVAEALAERADLAVLSSDRVRKELLGLDPLDHHPAAYGQGIYRPEVTERTYARLLEQAEALLGLGRSVVMDATFASAQHRRAVEAVGERTHSPVTWVRCRPPESVVAERLRRRSSHPDRLTDAGVAVASRLVQDADPWPDGVADPTEVTAADRPDVLDLDTSRPVTACVDTVVDRWG